MNIKHAKGKRIVGVRQHRRSEDGYVYFDVAAIILEDGTELRPGAVESEFEHGVDIAVVRNEGGGGA